MTLKEKIYQLFLSHIRDIKKEGDIKRFFEKYPVGGVYFSQFDVEDVGSLMKSAANTTRGFIQECRDTAGHQLVMCVDSALIEDGLRLFPSAVSAAGDDELFKEFGDAFATQLVYNDIDIVFGPCIDMVFQRLADFNSKTCIESPEYNVRMHAPIVKAIQDHGVAATVKHFPGQGTYHVNFHYGPARNILDFETWKRTFGYCYQKMIDQDVMCIMTSHMSLLSYCSESEEGFPPIATYSSRITQDLLKKEMGFRGAVVTDALVMGGMAVGDQVKEAVQAFKCGADFLLWAPLEAADAIEEKLLSGEIPMSRLEDALQRTQRVRDFVRQNKQTAPADPKEKVNAFARKSYACAAELLKNQSDALPLQKTDKILVIGNAPDENRMNQARRICEQLTAQGYDATFQEYLLTCFQEEINAICDPYDKIIFVLNHPTAVGEFQNCASTTWASHHVDKSKKIILNASSPYLAEDYYPDEPVIINTNIALTPEVAEILVGQLSDVTSFRGKANITWTNLR